VDAALPREPEHAISVEGGCVEIGVAALLREREGLYVFGFRIDPHDRVEAAIRDPGGAVGTDDHAMRRRLLAQFNLSDGACVGIEPPERSQALSSVPDRSVGGGGNIVRTGSFRNGIVADVSGERGRVHMENCNKQD